MKITKRINLIVLGLIMAAFVFNASFCYAYWNSFAGTKGSHDLNLTVGNFEDGSIRDRLNNVISENDKNYGIIEWIENLEGRYPSDVVNSLVDGVIDIISNDPLFDSDIFVSGSLESLFEKGTPANGDVLIYIEEGELIMVHISKNAQFHLEINSPENLEAALAASYSGINKISSVWLAGNRYTTFSTPVEYFDQSENRERYFLLRNNGPAGTPPLGNSSWFEVTEDFEWIQGPGQGYFTNYIVKHNNNYFISRWNNSNQPTISDWGAWGHIPLWNADADYNFSQSWASQYGVYVHTVDGGKVRFWRALTASKGVTPNEESARAGIWQEISNGWIGAGQEVRSFYVPYNTYSAGDIVICGVTAKLNYKYFRAKQNILANADGEETYAPIILNEHGVKVINDAYWEAWT